MIAREKAIQAHRALLNGGKLSYFEQRAISAETVRAVWVGYDVTSGAFSYPCIARGGFGVLCSKHVLMDLESMPQERVGIKPYSEDLRVRIVRAVQDGMSKSAAARLFAVSLSSVKRYARIAQRGESLMPRRGGGRPPKADEITRGGCSKRGQGVGRGSRMRVALSATLLARSTGR